MTGLPVPLWWHRVCSISYQQQENLDAALAAEIEAIRKFQPVYNQQHREPSPVLDLFDMFFGGYTDAPVSRIAKMAKRKAT